jgi:hypothetical protein
VGKVVRVGRDKWSCIATIVPTGMSGLRDPAAFVTVLAVSTDVGSLQ